jgi:hypothetical protein
LRAQSVRSSEEQMGAWETACTCMEDKKVNPKAFDSKVVPK